jgi:Sec-independent protein translocase protein TatA
MFGFSLAEMTVVALVALILLGPEKLPQVMRAVARGYAQLARIKAEFSRAVEAGLAPLAPLDPKNWRGEIKKIAPEIDEIRGLVDKVKDRAKDPTAALPRPASPDPNSTSALPGKISGPDGFPGLGETKKAGPDKDSDGAGR